MEASSVFAVRDSLATARGRSQPLCSVADGARIILISSSSPANARYRDSIGRRDQVPVELGPFWAAGNDIRHNR